MKRGRKRLEKFEKKYWKPTESPLLLTKGKGDHIEKYEEENEEKKKEVEKYKGEEKKMEEGEEL